MFNALNKPDSIAREIIEAIEYHGRAGVPEIREFHNKDSTRYAGTIKDLKRCSLIENVESEKSHAVYKLTERGIKTFELIERIKPLQSGIKAVCDC